MTAELSTSTHNSIGEGYASADRTTVGTPAGVEEGEAFTSAGDYASLFTYTVVAADQARPRSQQTADGVIGVSDLMSCAEKVRLTLIQAEPTDAPSSSAARIGTYIHESVLPARQQILPHLLIEQEVTATLPSGWTVTGHADEIDPTEPSYTDLKTKDGIGYQLRHGATVQERAARNVYYLGAAQGGLVPPVGMTRNVYMDRSGTDERVAVDQSVFDMDEVHAADLWLGNVIDAAKSLDVEAPKEWPLWKCRSFCQFFTRCRGSYVPEGRTADPGVIAAAAAYYTAKLEADSAKGVLAGAKEVLTGFSGVAGGFVVKETVVPGSEKRAGYTTVDVQPLAAS